MGFQEVARSAGRVIGIAYDAARAGLLLPDHGRSRCSLTGCATASPGGGAGARVALITAVVQAQPANAARNVDAARMKNACRMSDVSFLLRLLEPDSRVPVAGIGSRPLGEHRVRQPLESRKTAKPLFLAEPVHLEFGVRQFIAAFCRALPEF